jgi:hypothetical protein
MRISFKDADDYLKDQERRMQQPLPQDRTGDVLLKLLIGIIGWTYSYVRPVFLIYLAPFLLGGLAYIACALGVSWYESLAPGTLSFTPFTEGQVLKAIGHFLGLALIFLIAIAGVLGSIAAIAYGVYTANWVMRVVSAYYIVSGARALYYWFYDMRTDHPFGTIFLICFAISLASEGVQILWRKIRNSEE